MSDILSRIKKSVVEKKKTKSVTRGELQKWGLTGIQLRQYQLDGIRWLTECLEKQQGCILGDEMGLGKTCQTISLLVYMCGARKDKGPFLILSPLSVLENWRNELDSFAPSLTVLCCDGDKEKRAAIQRETRSQDFHVLLTTYELCLRDASFLKRWKWKVLVVDEAHRLKNPKSRLHQTLTQFSVKFRLLLTGTPIQNNLQELYSLLTFIQPSIFTLDEMDSLVDYYADVQKKPTLAAKLQRVLEPFLLRRVKSEVALDLPRKVELVVYHGMSALQKKYYKAVLMKNAEAFGNEQRNKNRMLNILVNLRKCVNHPYLFDGVEPEPFEMGEHLVDASGKLCLLDSILTLLHKDGHRVLLFSQMTRMLDIIQDYLEYKNYSYERLDGSVRGEERNLAVKNFSSKDIFIFLLSTKAGGVGLNLTAADTVIFVDTDFNPQNDLQAAARCHRIGQSRPVKVIRLLARNTVEEMMYSRAMSKLDLTNTVIEEGRFSLLNQPSTSTAQGMQLSEILKFGVDKLLSSEESSVQDVKLEKILGTSRNGQWVNDDDMGSLGDDEDEEEEEEEDEEEEEEEESDRNHMYFFEGKDYRQSTNSRDFNTFDRLVEEHQAAVQSQSGEGRALRHKTTASPSFAAGIPTRKRRPLTEAEQDLRRQKKEEAAAKRAKTQEETKRRQQERKSKKKLAWWDSCGYRSLCLQSVDSEEDEEDFDEVSSVCSTDSEDSRAIHYVLGDVTHPHAAKEDAIIVHCVDDSGRWGRGGLFTALETRSDEPRKQYELAGKMEDLELGHVLLFPIDDKQSRVDGQDRLALIVAQHRDKHNNLSGIFLSALDQGLKKIYVAAKRLKASVHLPRIGHSTQGFNWYGTERLIRKHLASRGISTFIYYHSRVSNNTAPPQMPSPAAATSSPPADPPPRGSDTPASTDTDAESPGPSAAVPNQSGSVDLPGFMTGVHVFFFNLPASERKSLARYLITYDGDEEDVMSPDVTHVVGEVENDIHSQELQQLVGQFTQAVAVQKAWLDSCFSKQRKVDTKPFTHLFE